MLVIPLLLVFFLSTAVIVDGPVLEASNIPSFAPSLEAVASSVVLTITAPVRLLIDGRIGHVVANSPSNEHASGLPSELLSVSGLDRDDDTDTGPAILPMRLASINNIVVSTMNPWYRCLARAAPLVFLMVPLSVLVLYLLGHWCNSRPQTVEHARNTSQSNGIETDRANVAEVLPSDQDTLPGTAAGSTLDTLAHHAHDMDLSPPFSSADKSLAVLETSLASSRTLSNAAVFHVPPILTLPTELLAEILTYAALSSVDITAEEERSKNIQCVLLQVCRSFYEVALTTPYIWRHIRLPLHTRCAEAWLIRSGAVPLDITIDAETEAVLTLSRRLLHRPEVMARCSKLVFLRCAQGFLPVLNLPAPNMETLGVVFCSSVGHGAHDYESRPLFAAQAPKLRTVCLTGMAPLWPASLSMSLNRLTLLFPVTSNTEIWHLPTVAELLNLLSAARSLKHLSLFNVRFRDSAQGVPQLRSFDLPSLTFCELVGLTLHHLPLFLQYIGVSHPYKLELRCGKSANDDVAQRCVIPVASERFFVQVQELVIVGTRVEGGIHRVFDGEHIISILSLTPNLKTLTLKGARLDQTFFSALTGVEQRLPLVPKMRKFNADASLVPTFEEVQPSISEMVRSRRMTLTVLRP